MKGSLRDGIPVGMVRVTRPGVGRLGVIRCDIFVCMDSPLTARTNWGSITKVAREHLALLLDDSAQLTQSLHARMCQLPRQSLSSYEREIIEPSYTTIDRMLYALGLDMRWNLLPLCDTPAHSIQVDIGDDLDAIQVPDYGEYEKVIRQYFFWPGMLIRSARIRSATTQAEIAALSRTTQSAISAYERDCHQPSLSAVERIVRSVGFSPVVTVIPYDDSTELHWRHQAQFPGPTIERTRQWQEEYFNIAGHGEKRLGGLGFRPNPLIDERYKQYRRSLLEYVA